MLALAAEEVHKDRSRHKGDREGREPKEAHEKEFECDEIHSTSLDLEQTCQGEQADDSRNEPRDQKSPRDARGDAKHETLGDAAIKLHDESEHDARRERCDDPRGTLLIRHEDRDGDSPEQSHNPYGNDVADLLTRRECEGAHGLHCVSPDTDLPTAHYHCSPTGTSGGRQVAQLLLLRSAEAGPVLPALQFLSHKTTERSASPALLAAFPDVDAVILDGRGDLMSVRALCRLLHTASPQTPVILVCPEGILAAVSADWQIADIVLTGATPSEVETRIRLATGRVPQDDTALTADAVSVAGLTIDESSYSARVNGDPVDLTFKEFQLLHFLATHPSRVFTREQLLSEVWGYDYYGGTRTIDVHVRRLRAKLGEYEALIGTVRNVGYRFSPEM